MMKNVNVYFNGNGNSKRMCGSGGNTDNTAGVVTRNRDPRATLSAICRTLDEEFASRYTIYDGNFSYTDHFNTWVNGTRNTKTRYEQLSQYDDDTGRRTWIVRQAVGWSTCNGPLDINGEGHGLSVAEAKSRACFACIKFLLKKWRADATLGGETSEVDQFHSGDEAYTQMDGTPSGDVDQQSSRAQNTIITRDDGAVSSISVPRESLLQYASSEKCVTFPELTSRWMPLPQIEVTTAKNFGDVLRSFDLPESLYIGSTAPNLLPYESYVYGEYEVEFKFVVNANKFHCGKILVSVKFDPYQVATVKNTICAGLARPHTILDLAMNSEGTLKVPFHFRRAAVRNNAHPSASTAVRPAKFASVDVMVLSKLNVANGSPNNMFIRPFYKINRATFAGMSYRISTQMDRALELALGDNALPAIKELIIGAEKAIDQMGKSHNQDKPTSNVTTVVVPRAQSHFANGKGLSSAQVLRMSPAAATNFSYVNRVSCDPLTTLDIARVYGIRNKFEWKSSDVPGTALFDIPIDPCSRSYTADYMGTPTPLEYMCGMYQFWSGTIEVRMDFVTNAFHTGTIMISAEYNRPPRAPNENQSASTYTKTFHLGDQKTVSFRIPYIYDTVMRRSTNMVYNPIISGQTTSDAVQRRALSVMAMSNSKLRVTVINGLRPVESVAQSVEVLFFWRAGPDFALMGLKQQSFRNTEVGNVMDNFPLSSQYSNLAGVVKPRATDVTQSKRNNWNEVKTTSREASTQADRNVLATPTTSTQPTLNRRNPDYKAPFPDPYAWTGHTNLLGSDDSDDVATQMDNGEKDTFDTTDDFEPGKNALLIQSSDPQISIKDILRQPVMLIDAYQHNGGTSAAFYLPAMLPDWTWRTKQSDTNITQPMLHVTPQVSLINLFRFWRGSLRYTIIVHGDPQVPVYVTYVPHSGVRIFGPFTPGADDQVKQRIYNSGLRTEIIIPSVNPTATIEVPFETENNWCLIGEEEPKRNYSWRDKADTNIGHLAITCNNIITFSIWFAVGDDFEIANFYGTPSSLNDDWAYQLSDMPKTQRDPIVGAKPKKPKPCVYLYGLAPHGYFPCGIPKKENTLCSVQMDSGFRLKDGVTKVTSVLGKMSAAVNVKNLVRVGVFSLPVVGTACGVASVVDDISRTADEGTRALQSITHTANKTDELLVKCGITLDVLMKLIDESACKLETTIKAGATWMKTMSDAILDIVVAWVTNSWIAVGAGVVRFVLNSIGHPINTFMNFAVRIGEYIGLLNNDLPRVQAPPSQDSTMVGILAGLVGTIMGVVIDPRRFTNIPRALLERITSQQGTAYLLSMLRFVQGCFEVVRDMVLASLGMVSVEARALADLSMKSLTMKKFVTNAQMVLSEANSSLMMSPQFRLRSWMTVAQATKIQQRLLEVPPNHASPVLARLCGDVMKWGNEKYMDLAASPVRFEPYVLAIEGAPGIGKSFIVDSLVEAMLKATNYQRPPAGYCFTRAPGTRFWSGYRDQPCILYDDWLNISASENVVQQLSELYQLKSVAVFIPEMAHLEEKKMRGNPLLVVLACNDAYPNNIISSCVPHRTAVLRRREMVVQARLRANYTREGIRTMTAHEKETFAHLEFGIEPRNDMRSNNITFDRYEVFLEKLVASYSTYHAQEQENVQRRMRKVRESLDGMYGEIPIDDPFEIFYNASGAIADAGIHQNAWLPSEQLCLEVDRLVSSLGGLGPVEEVLPDGGVVVEAPGWKRTMSLLAAGFVTAPAAFKMMLHLSQKAIKAWISWYQNVNGVVSAQCCVCREERTPITRVCARNGMPVNLENSHNVCGPCYENLIIHGRPNCPVCRFSHLSSVLPEEFVGQLTLGMRATYAVTKSVDKTVEWLNEFFSTPYVKQLAHAYMICDAATLFQMAMDPATIVIAARMMADGVIGMFQSDTSENSTEEVGETSISKVYRPIETDSVLEPKLNYEACLIQELKENTREVPCFHRQLMNECASARYRGDWWIPYSGGVVVFDGKCKGTCFWKEDEQAQRRFYESYLSTHRNVLRDALRGYVNNDRSEDFYRNKVPPVFRPGWMRAMPVEEIAQLTQETWWEFLTGTFARYKTMISWLCGACAVIGGILAIANVFGSDLPTSQSELKKDHGSKNYKAYVRAPRSYFVSPESACLTIEGAVRQQIARNYISIWTEGETTISKIMSGVGLYNLYALLPRHYIHPLREAVALGKRIFVAPALFPHERKEYTYDAADFVISDVADIAIWKLPASFNMFKDIRKFIATDEDFSESLPHHGSILVAPSSSTPAVEEVEIEINGIKASQYVTDPNGNFEARDVLAYNFSKVGACGSIVLAPRTTRPIVAMHFAGTGRMGSGCGFGVLLSKELLAGFQKEDVVTVEFAQGEWETVENARLIVPTNVHYLGSLRDDQTPYCPQKSKIRKSLIHGMEGLEPTKFPAILSKSDVRYAHENTPLWEGVKKHGVLTRDFSTSQIKRAEAALGTWLMALKPVVPNASKLSVKEAIGGLFGVEYYERINLATSAGWPWVTTERKQKSDYISLLATVAGEVLDVEIDPRITAKLEENATIRMSGCAVETLFIDTLKDERKSKEKLVKVGATRVFCNPPVEYVIAMRQSFLHFCAAFMANRHDMMHAVGIDVLGTEWSRLAHDLCSTNANGIVTLDYSNFGPGFNACVARSACNLIIQWTKDNVVGVSAQEMTCLMDECVHSVHAAFNTVYQQKAGSPSGAPITTIINSLVNQLYVLIAWDSIVTRQEPVLSFDAFRTLTCLRVYGDDLIMAVDKSVIDKFNGKTISAFFGTYNIVATDAEKTSSVAAHVPILRARFLKRGFKPHPTYAHMWCSPPYKEDVEDITQWVWETRDYKFATRENACAALVNAHALGLEYYNDLKSKINKALIRVRIPPITTQWEDYDALFFPFIDGKVSTVILKDRPRLVGDGSISKPFVGEQKGVRIIA